MSLGNIRHRAAQHAGRQVERAAGEVQPWVERLARLGMVAKGVVYGIIGLLAFRAAFGLGGKTTDATGALVTLLSQPFGQVLLGLVGVGLVGFGAWRWVQAILAPGSELTGLKAVGKRIAHAASGTAHLLLAWTAFRMLQGQGGKGASAQEWTARFLNAPFGQWLVMAAGVAIIIAGLMLWFRAYQAKFRKHLRLEEMSPTEEKWAMLSGRIGYAARGTVWALIGFFLLQAGMHLNSREVRDVKGVLNALLNQPAGPWMLGAVAAGLVAYAVHMFVAARYRKVWS